METTREKRTIKQWLLGDYSWGLKLSWSLATIMTIVVLSVSEVGISQTLMNGDLNFALLLYALGYLSDIRYRLFEDVRND
ncbi:hypothetical protein [Thalassotalea euphylliae]|uniref:Uncharacterized protein n=1 Tax=Thalassotalea euphylliae TaxID=1655234 RepID=A0A3E0UCC2_9GAMM|nr:hypothetical protein [Thalassotalea euphylliae]REL34661.1 hypothetical protein DXX92_04410 [Thalassotalea euphylliae]